jgi:voltage-gated potassium channel
LKFFTAQFAAFRDTKAGRRNLRLLGSFVLLLHLIVVTYAIVFRVIMSWEGQDYSWVSGFYWVFVVMSTLGLGDIAFESDIGRIFTMIVAASGLLFLLVMLPFMFIELVYSPWVDAQRRSRAPRQVPDDTRDHVILTHYDPITIALIERLRSFGREYYLLEDDLNRALDLHDQGVAVLLGEVDDPATYQAARIRDAALVVATADDYMNSNIAFTVREVSEDVPIVAFARSRDSVDVLSLAGSSHVLQLTEMLGRSLARRSVAGDIRANVIGQFGELLIAEATVSGTPIVGRSLGDGWLRDATGLTVVGLWERGMFTLPDKDRVLDASTVLVLAGSAEQLHQFGELTAIYNLPDAPVLILGGGRVGRAVSRALRERGIDYRIIEQEPSRVKDPERTIVGSAADLLCLEAAGIRQAPTTVVTTSDDATNIYLTIYCRKLRPDMQIISRSNLEKNTSTLHRAGADFVMSYASMGANAVFNILEKDDVVMVAEGLDVFRTPVPGALAGRSLSESNVRQKTGCSVVALEVNGKTVVNPDPNIPLPDGSAAELIVIGDTEAENRFLRHYAGESGTKPARN